MTDRERWFLAIGIAVGIALTYAGWAILILGVTFGQQRLY
jgi:hypothetical protein